MSTQLPVLTDRSRTIVFGKCERQRFFEYHCLLTGIRKAKLNLATSVGTAAHRGRSLLLEGKDIEEAVFISIKEFSESILSTEIDLEDNEEQLFVFEEQKAMIEGMIRIWNIVQLPKLLKEYEVMDIEQILVNEPNLIGSKIVKAIEPEINWVLVPSDENNSAIEFMSRPDAIYRSKLTGNLVVDSFKTTSSNTNMTWNEDGEPVDKNKYDDQGISELIAVETLTGEKVESIKMDFFIKGRRVKSLYTFPDGTTEKRKLQQSFIVHPWKKDGGFEVEYSTKFSWTDEMGNNRRLGKGWKRVDIWQEMTMKEWIQILVDEFYEDLESVVLTPEPYMRQEDDIQNWKEQIGYQEDTIRRHLDHLKSIDPLLPGPRESKSGKVYKTMLNRYFPQRRDNCYQWGGFCPFAISCWEGEPTISSLYEKRIPHHEKELLKNEKQ